MTRPELESPILAARYSPRFRRFFAGYGRRLLRKKFAAVRLSHGSDEALSAIDRHAGPAMVVMSHPSWWDPIVGLIVGERFFPGRPVCGPVESEQWRKFGFMKRLGLFGLVVGHPGAMLAMVTHVVWLFESEPRTVLGITPQGAFADVRDESRIRPGAAAIAAGTSGVLVVSLTLEYAFWNERKPEVFIRAEAVGSPSTLGTTAWHRAITRTMSENSRILAGLVRARDASGFEPLIRGTGAQTNPVYDLWLRLRGLEPRIEGRPRAARGTRSEART